MDDERWKEVKKVLNAALLQAPEARASFVEHVCEGDEALREEVVSLLAFHDQSSEIVDRPVFDVNADDPLIDCRLGQYRVVRLLGHGGMGKVYLAKREDDYSKRVAIKLIQRGRGAAERIARFHEERQILAGLDHPSIARLLDGGTVSVGTRDDGLPYLVMELVEGEPIDRYCDSHRLGVRQRLELLRQVLPAIEFSHQRLVVHRDLKPGNILVTEDGTPKLIDFGIAKFLQSNGNIPVPESSDQRRRPMSPRYASPEQVRGEAVTTATDVYSLGVLLYKLLSGHHPYLIDAADPEEFERVICTATPIAPSATVRTFPVDGSDDAPDPELVAWARHTTTGRLARQLFDEIDAIVMKAMRKVPQERYSSVARLADDIDCYLAGLPIHARAHTLTYRLRKFVPRYRMALAAGVLALMASAATLTLFVLHSRLDRERAQSQAIEKFVTDLFRAADPDRSDGQELTVRHLLDRGSDHLDGGLIDQPLMRATLLGVVGRTYLNLGDESRAEELLEEALRLQRIHDPEADDAMAWRTNDLGTALSRRGDLAGAGALYREAFQHIGGNCRSNKSMARWIISNLAWTLSRQGADAEAEKLMTCLAERGYPLSERLKDPAEASVLNKLAAIRYRQSRFGEAEVFFRDALAISENYYKARHTKVANALNNLGKVLSVQEKYGESEAVLRRGLAIRRELLKSDHLDLANIEKNLAHVLTMRGRATEAEPLARHALTVLRSRRSAADWKVADAEGVLGECLAVLGRCAEARPLLKASSPVIEGQAAVDLPQANIARLRLDRVNKICEGR